MAYKNVVFDVGSVLVGFRWPQMLQDYGMTSEEAASFGAAIFQNPLWKQFDLEILSFEEVVDLYVKEFPQYESTIRWFFSHAELMRVPRPRVWEKLHQLKQAGYRLYLLSNYSSVLFGKHVGDAPFHADLDGGVISYQIHKIKPEEDIYRALFEKYALSPAECLFFDDRIDNVETSRRVGMDAVQVTSEDQLLEKIDEILLS